MHRQSSGQSENGWEDSTVADSVTSSAFAYYVEEVTRQTITQPDKFRCYCYVLAQDAAYCKRTLTIKEYLQANLDVSRESRVSQYKKAEASEGVLVNEGNFVHRSSDRDSTLGEKVEVAGRTVIKKSIIGHHCRIGTGVKLTNVVLMNHIVIGDNVNITNSVVCSNVEVREGASLKDVQVPAGVTIEAGVVYEEYSIE